MNPWSSQGLHHQTVMERLDRLVWPGQFDELSKSWFTFTSSSSSCRDSVAAFQCWLEVIPADPDPRGLGTLGVNGAVKPQGDARISPPRQHHHQHHAIITGQPSAAFIATRRKIIIIAAINLLRLRTLRKPCQPVHGRKESKQRV